MTRFRMIHPVVLLGRMARVATICATASACQTTTDGNLTASIDKTELSSTAANAIAGDMVSKFAEVVGPGSGTVVLKSDRSPFGEALASSLKRWGYAVATPDQKAADGKLIPLSYVIDSFEGNTLARLSTPTVDLGRAYSLTSAGAAPSSPLSVMHRN